MRRQIAFLHTQLDRNHNTENNVRRYIEGKLNIDDLSVFEEDQIERDYKSIISHAKDKDKMEKCFEHLNMSNFPDDCPEYKS